MKWKPILLFLLAAGLRLAQSASTGANPAPTDPTVPPDGWQTAAPRDEIRPSFAYAPNGGRESQSAFIIKADAREGLDGFWTKTFPVKGGRHYHFEAFRKVQNVASPRRSVPVRLLWHDDAGEPVRRDGPVVKN